MMFSGVLKMSMAAIMAVLGFLSSMAPRFAMAVSQNVFSLGNMMASGVLLAAGLVHQLPSAQDTFSQSNFPWGGFICGLSFTFFLMMEEVVHTFVESEHTCSSIEHEHHKHDHRHHNHHHHHDEVERLSHNYTPEAYNSVEANGIVHNHKNTIFVSNPTVLLERESTLNSAAFCPDADRGFLQRRATVEMGTRNQSRNQSWLQKSVIINSVKSHHHEDHLAHHLQGSFWSSLGLLVALSIHGVLEGLGVGLLDQQGAKSAAIAILAHKVFAGYALGSTLTAASEMVSHASYYVMISIFSLSTPTGILLAVFLEQRFHPSPIVIATLKATVAGTFLYISIFEVCMKELLVCRSSLTPVGKVPPSMKRFEMAKLASLMFGYGIMSSLAIWV